MADLYGLSLAQIAKLQAVADAVDNGLLVTGVQQSGRRNLQPARIAVGILTDSIAAITGLTGTPKVGTLNVYSFTSTGTTDTGLDITVYNFAPQAATTDRWSVAERDAFTGKWVLTTQFCS